MKNNKIRFIIPALVLLLGPLVAIMLKFGSEHLVSSRENDEYIEMNQAYTILFKALDRYVETNGHCPPSLSNLNVGDLPLSLDAFHYTCNKDLIAIRFSGKFINSRRFGDYAEKNIHLRSGNQ